VCRERGRCSRSTTEREQVEEPGEPDDGRYGMDVQDVIARARDAITVERVFGEPYERNGVTVIPVARVQGGAGGGGGEDPSGQGRGSGSGFGIIARPVGVFLIRGDQVTWHPAVDVTRIVLGGQVLGIVAVLALRSILKARAKQRR
jgi:uncharacterized spore protein YtfJ